MIFLLHSQKGSRRPFEIFDFGNGQGSYYISSWRFRKDFTQNLGPVDKVEILI